ncbi:hypothetical protein K438DRAFT_1944499 [Mycena galopus ATCC 62051]|nr:hypothetical protein K438DRAFT_1944499 [Mycena galopus ATCC 62051]
MSKRPVRGTLAFRRPPTQPTTGLPGLSFPGSSLGIAYAKVQSHWHVLCGQAQEYSSPSVGILILSSLWISLASLRASAEPRANLNTDPSSSANANEDTFIRIGNIEGTLLCLTGLVENLSNPAPHTASNPGVPPSTSGSGLFANVHPAAKSVLKPNSPFVFDGDQSLSQLFLHTVRTYARLISEAFDENSHTSEEKAVRFTMLQEQPLLGRPTYY